MGIFTRVRDIINSNINSILDHAEEPEKLIRLMIQEMEETLVEVKASCAQAMAAVKKIGRELEAVQGKLDSWEVRARLAVEKGRDDLAREALIEKRSFAERAESLKAELAMADEHVAQYQEDISKLEEKLASARDKQRSLVARHMRAKTRKQAYENLRRYDSASAMLRFDHIENRIERMEAEAELAARPGKPSLEQEYARLEHDEDIERELARLKTGQSPQKTGE